MAKKWSKADEDDLIASVKNHVGILEIAKNTNRTVNALNIRMDKIFVSQMINNTLDDEFAKSLPFYMKKKKEKKEMEKKKEIENRGDDKRTIELEKRILKLETILDQILDYLLQEEE